MASISQPPTPEISVIVPAYNAGRFLDDCLTSVAKQEHSVFEVIIVDDGSTDNTGAIAARFAEGDKRFRVIRQANKGVGAARNAGLEASKGGYILFLDADDTLLPGALKTLLEAVCESDAEMAVGKMLVGENLPEDNARLTRRKGKTKVLTGEVGVERTLYQTIHGAYVCGNLYRRHLLSNIRFDTDSRYEDLNVAYRIMLNAKKVAFIDDYVYFYRQHNQSFINTLSRNRFDVLDVTDRMQQFFENRSPRLLAAAGSRRFAAHCDMYGLLCRLEKQKVTLLTQDEAAQLKQRCMEVILHRRRAELFGRGVRLRNRGGALLSYFPAAFRFFLTRRN